MLFSKRKIKIEEGNSFFTLQLKLKAVMFFAAGRETKLFSMRVFFVQNVLM